MGLSGKSFNDWPGRQVIFFGGLDEVRMNGTALVSYRKHCRRRCQPALALWRSHKDVMRVGSYRLSYGTIRRPSSRTYLVLEDSFLSHFVVVHDVGRLDIPHSSFRKSLSKPYQKAFLSSRILDAVIYDLASSSVSSSIRLKLSRVLNQPSADGFTFQDDIGLNRKLISQWGRPRCSSTPLSLSLCRERCIGDQDRLDGNLKRSTVN